MTDLNTLINTSRQFTAPPSMDTLPATSHDAQVDYGMEIARRAAQQVQEPAPVPMPPIVPVAN